MFLAQAMQALHKIQYKYNYKYNICTLHIFIVKLEREVTVVECRLVFSTGRHILPDSPLTMMALKN